MFCAQCGKEIPAGITTCPACGFSTAGSAGGRSATTIHEMVNEARRAARDLADAANELTRHVKSGAEAAKRDPKGTTKRAIHRAAKELESAVDEVDRLLQRL
jgi:signal transduction histidine kinase